MVLRAVDETAACRSLERFLRFLEHWVNVNMLQSLVFLFEWVMFLWIKAICIFVQLGLRARQHLRSLAPVMKWWWMIMVANCIEYGVIYIQFKYSVDKMFCFVSGCVSIYKKKTLVDRKYFWISKYEIKFSTWRKPFV